MNLLTYYNLYQVIKQLRDSLLSLRPVLSLSPLLQFSRHWQQLLYIKRPHCNAKIAALRLHNYTTCSRSLMGHKVCMLQTSFMYSLKVQVYQQSWTQLCHCSALHEMAIHALPAAIYSDTYARTVCRVGKKWLLLLFNFWYLSRSSHTLFTRSHMHSCGRLINQQINSLTDQVSPLIVRIISQDRRKTSLKCLTKTTTSRCISYYSR